VRSGRSRNPADGAPDARQAVIFDAFLQGKEEEENDTLAEAEEMAKKRQDVEVKGWDAVVYMLIVANTVSMCLEFQGMSAELEAILNMANLFFTTVFALEMAIKLRIVRASRTAAVLPPAPPRLLL
jgi:hypothetical protein